LPSPLCKLNASPAPPKRPPLLARNALVLAAGAALIGLTACAMGPLGPRHIVNLAELEACPARVPAGLRCHVVSDPAALQPLIHPLGRRLGLLEVTSEGQWRQLSQAVPQVGPCPDLRRGIVIGVVSSGTRLDGGTPFWVQAIRVHNGAGLVELGFNPGTYLPDGSAYLETTYVAGLRAVLVVNVDGFDYIASGFSHKATSSRTFIVH